MKKLLFCVLGVTLAAAQVRAAAPTARDLLRYVPPTAGIVVGMDAAALRDHPMVQSWLLDHQEAWCGRSHGDELLRDAGLDPFRDVDSMVVGVVQGEGNGQGLAAFGGRFDPAAIEAALISRGGERVTVGSRSAVRLVDPQHPRSDAPLLIVTSDLALVGDQESLAFALAASRPVNALVNGEIDAGRLDPAAPFWAVATMPPQVRQRIAAHAEAPTQAEEAPFAQVVAASRTILRVSMQASLDDELRLVGSAAADTAEDAELLRDTVRGVIAAARLHLQDTSPDLVEVLRDIRVSVDGTEVRGTAEVPLALIEKLQEEHHEIRPRHVVRSE